MDEKEKYFVFRSFVESDEAQRRLASEVFHCHAVNEEYKSDELGGDVLAQFDSLSCSSTKLNLGISCGGDLATNLPNAVDLARRAFQQAAIVATSHATAETLKLISKNPLSGLSLLYGIHASMTSHYDSPTQPGQREEWLCMISFGNTILFRCDNEIVTVHSGDVIVMDSMAVLHGVERILPDNSLPSICTRIGFPLTQVRLGVILWQGKLTPDKNPITHPEEEINLEDAFSLFDCDDDAN
jgi:hypothetical protein